MVELSHSLNKFYIVFSESALDPNSFILIVVVCGSIKLELSQIYKAKEIVIIS